MDNIIFTCQVHEDWVDYNGHMNDAEYARVFSLSLEQLMVEIGIDEDFRNENQYSIFTLETHICYLAEANKDETLRTAIHILDFDDKRIHAFFTMYNKDDVEVATSEQMLMGMDMNEGRPASFPDSIYERLEAMANDHKDLAYPERAGSQIGIRRK